MSRRQSSDPLKNTFPFPNEIFILGLCPGELAVYSYLLCCANRKTGQCWPSYKVIGKAVGMTENTVAKYVSSLEHKGLIQTEPTTVTTKAGIKRNGNLLYTVFSLQCETGWSGIELEAGAGGFQCEPLQLLLIVGFQNILESFPFAVAISASCGMVCRCRRR